MKRLSESALDVLGTGIALNGRELRIDRALDRKLYVEVNAALEALGGKWNRKAKVHVFDEDPADALDQVLVDGGFHDKKRDLNQFFTPPAFAKSIVQLANVRGKKVLEPSTGMGALLAEIREQGASYVYCVEIDRKCANVLLTNPPGSGCPISVFEGDFLGPGVTTVCPKVDRVVMNSPFARQQDIEHVTRALSFLRSGGRLVAIMSAGVVLRTDRKSEAFRSLVALHGGTITKNPDKTFATSGTDVHTVTVVIDVVTVAGDITR